MTRHAMLTRAVNQRIRCNGLMKTKRKDHAEIIGSIGMVQRFLRSYPSASDSMVREWCRKNIGHVSRVCIGGTGTLRKLTAWTR